MSTKSIFIPIIIGMFFSQSIGQVQPRRLQTDMIGGAGVSFEQWKAKDDKITEMAIPITFLYPYSSKISFYAVTSHSASNLEAGEKYSLSGLSDLKWGGHYLTLDDQLLLTFGMNLPTGKHALETEEYAVASVLSLPAFNFRVPTLGQGLDFQLGANSAREFGEWVFGFGATYLMKGGFKPFKGFDESYNPGDEMTLAVGGDRKATILGKAMQIKADALYTIYSDDTWGKEKVFRSGNRILLQVLSAFKQGPFDVNVFIRERMKGKNKTGGGVMYETEIKNSNANQFEVQGWGYYPFSRNVRLKGVLDFKLYSDSDYETGGATLLGIGGGGQFQLSPKLVFNGDLRFYTGKIKSGAEKISTQGLKLYGGVEVTL